MLKKLVVTFGLAALLATGCGSPDKKPPVEKPANFPEARYLTAQGSGATAMEARRQALAALSGIFESRVQSETTTFALSAIGPNNTELFEKTVESKIAIISAVELKGAKIGRAWESAGPLPYHALAVIDRMQAARDWATELETVAARTLAQVKTLGQTQGRFQRMVILNRIISGVLHQQALESRLRVLNYPARAGSEVDVEAIAAELVALRSQLRFFINFSGDWSSLALEQVSGTLTASGFLLGDDRNTADALIIGVVKISPLELNNPRAAFVRATATARLIETGTDAVVATFSENVRKGHVDQSEAARKAALHVSRTLAKKLVAAIGSGNATEERPIE